MAPVTGWYPDPAGTAQLRFWDGQTWTSATAPLPVAAPPPGPLPAPLPTPQPAYASQPMAVTEPYPPQQFAPQQPAPQQFASQQFAPQGHAPQQYAPQGYAPQQYGPQPGYTGAQGPQLTYANRPGHRPPSRGKRFYAMLAGGVAAVVVIATVVPIALSSDHPKPPPTSAAFTGVLLTVNEVDAATGGRFTVGPLSDDGNDDDNSEDCKDVGDSADPNTNSTSQAERTFTDSSQGDVADESLDYLPGKAAAALAGLKKSAAACHSVTIDGDKVSVTVLPAPAVPHSDDTFDMQMSGTTAGHQLTIEITVARFGDSLVTLVYGGLAAPTTAQASAATLLRQASAKAQTVI